jgi:hypothetical protein
MLFPRRVRHLPAWFLPDTESNGQGAQPQATQAHAAAAVGGWLRAALRLNPPAAWSGPPRGAQACSPALLEELAEEPSRGQPGAQTPHAWLFPAAITPEQVAAVMRRART